MEVMKRHHDFFQRRIAGAFAEAVDRRVHMRRAAHDRCERIGCRQSEIVVGVDFQLARHLRAKVAEDVERHKGIHDAERVGEAKASCACRLGGLGGGNEKLGIGAG